MTAIFALIGRHRRAVVWRKKYALGERRLARTFATITRAQLLEKPSESGFSGRNMRSTS
jgi:hypothetical protein